MPESKTLTLRLDPEATKHVRVYMKEVELDDAETAASDLICIAAGRRAALAKYAKKQSRKARK